MPENQPRIHGSGPDPDPKGSAPPPPANTSVPGYIRPPPGDDAKTNLPNTGARGSFRFWGPEPEADAIRDRVARLARVDSGKPGPATSNDQLVARARDTERGLRNGYPQTCPATVVGPGTRPGSIKVTLHFRDAEGEPANREQDNAMVGEGDQKNVFIPS